MKRFVYFLVVVQLLLFCSGSFAWFNDAGNDSCLTVYSERELYRPNVDGYIYPEYLIVNECGGAVTTNLGLFFEDKHMAQVSFAGMKTATKLDDYNRPVYTNALVSPSLSNIKSFNEKQAFSLKNGWSNFVVPDGNSYLWTSMRVPFEEGEWALTLEDPLDKSRHSTLDPLYTGAGTAADPYILNTCVDLQDMNNMLSDPGVWVELGQDIDCADTVTWDSGLGFKPINDFRGNFDGKLNTISNLFINRNDDGAGCMFEVLLDANILNMGLLDFNIWNEANHAAALSCTTNSTDINNVYVYGATIATGGTYYAGGLVTLLDTSGWNDSNITNVYVASTTVNGDNAQRVGGVVGLMQEGGTNGTGLVNVYSSAVVNGSSNEGGILGVDAGGFCASTYWDEDVSGQATSACGTARSTANMMKQAQYDANWNFTNIWTLVDDVNYPSLTQFAGGGGGGGSVPDANFWKIDGYDVNSGAPFFPDDSNITLTFTIFDVENDRVTVDIRYSTQKSAGSGTLLVDDLNLDADICTDIDWDDVASVCEWDWDPTGVADSNYFILFNFASGGDNNVLNSPTAFSVSGDLNIVIKAPINEATNVKIPPTNYPYTISFLDGNTLSEFTDLNADQNNYSVTRGTDYFIVLTVDNNNSAEFYPRTYYLKYAADEIYDVIQPYLAPVASSAEITFYTKDATDNSTVPNILIRSYKVISGFGRTEIESMRTDESGAGTMSMVVDDTYELVVYDADGVELFTKTIQANFTSYNIYIGTEAIPWEEPTMEWIKVSGFPDKGYIEFGPSGYDFNLVFDVNGGATAKMWMTIDTNSDSNVMFNSSCTPKCSYHVPKDLLDSILEIRLTAFVETDSGKTFYLRKAFIPLDKSGYNLISSLQGSAFRQTWCGSDNVNEPCFILLMLSAFLTIAAVASTGMGLTTDRNALSIVTIASLGIFVYLAWIPFSLFILVALGAGAMYMATWRMF